MDPLTGLATLAGVTLASVAGLRLKKNMEEGFAALPDRSTNYKASVKESQSRYNMFSQMVNPITNGVIPVGASESKVKEQKDLVDGALANYSAVFSPDSSQTVLLKKFQNEMQPRADGSSSVYMAMKFCREAGKQANPFTVLNTDGTVQTPGAVSADGQWKFDEICGVCLSSGVDEEGNRFRTVQGMLVDPNQRDNAKNEQEKNSWAYPRIGPALGTCEGAPNNPIFATSAKDLARYKSREACLKTKSIGGPDNCALCYDSEVYSSVPPDAQKYPVSLTLMGTGSVTLIIKGASVLKKELSESTPVTMELVGAKEGDPFVLNVAGSAQGQNLNIYGYMFSKTPKEGIYTMPLNLLMTVDDETGASPSKSGGFYNFSDVGLDVAKMRPGSGKTQMRLRGVLPFTFVEPSEFAAMDCLEAPYQTREASASAFSTDQPCFAKGSGPGRYNDACLRSRILDAGCTNAGDLFKNPGQLNNLGGTPQTLTKIYQALQAIADQDMIDPDATKKCSGRTISTPCDPFIERAGTLKFSDALRGTNRTLQTQAQQCLSFLYHNKGANELTNPPRVGPSYNGLVTYRNNQKEIKNIYCLPEGQLNPDKSTASRDTLARIGDRGYNGKVGIDAIKQYLTDQLNTAIDLTRNANSDPDRKSAILNCFGTNLSALPQEASTSPTVIANPCGVVAQYVRILPSRNLPANDAWIEISQLVVIDKNGVNVASGKSTAGTSAGYPTDVFGNHSPSMALDGQIYPKAQNFYISPSPGGNSQFLLNLGSPTDITKIIYITRGDSNNRYVYRKNGIRLQLLNANQAVVSERTLNASIREDINFVQAGSAPSCKSDLPASAPLTFPPGFTAGLYVRFFDITDANPDTTPGNRGWGDRIGTPNAYGKIQFTDTNLARPDRCGVVAKGYYVSNGPETLYLMTDSDDGIHVSFNNRQVISNWNIHGPARDSAAPIQIPAAGVYPFELRFYEWGGGAVCNLYYRVNDDATWNTDLTSRFAYKPAEVQQQEAEYQAAIRARQQASVSMLVTSPPGTMGLRITAPDGRTIKNDNGTLRLNRGRDITFDLSNRPDVYKASSGNIAISQSGTQSFMRHSGLIVYVNPFAANNGDFAWSLIPNGSGYRIKNEFSYNSRAWLGFGQPQLGSYLGYDAGSDSLKMMPYDQPNTWITWNITPTPSYVNRTPPPPERRAIMFGPWIGPRGNAEIPVQQTFVLPNGTKVYTIQDGGFTKMVTEAGESRYYQGPVSSFSATNWPRYTSAGTNYRLKFV